MAAASWDPDQYERFRIERERPFWDLVSRLPERPCGLLVDLGCGTGRLTRLLAERAHAQRAIGVDRSTEMLARARAEPGRVEWVEADVASWMPPGPVSLLFSNAALHWLDDHERLFPRLVERLEPGGVLAVQMPANHEAPAHRLIQEVAAEPRFANRLAGVRRDFPVLDPGAYVRMLRAAGCHVDAWETTYQHVLEGPDAVLEWLKGTALRPYLGALAGRERDPFLETLGGALRQAYPPSPDTVFPFRRIFFVANRPA